MIKVRAVTQTTTINKDGGIGIYATLEELTLVTLKNNNDTRRY